MTTKAVKMQKVHDKPRQYGEPYTSKDSDAFGIKFDPSEGRTKQSDAEACDINNIMKRYEATGLLPDMIHREPQWGDFSDMATYQEAMDIVAKAREQFFSLDAHLRKEFNNDPAQFLEFCEDPKNVRRMVELGIATPVEKPEPTDRDYLKTIAENTKAPKTKDKRSSGASSGKPDPE